MTWVLDPEVTFLNHGSFGACPRAVLDAQRAIQERIERQPVQFYVRELFERLDAARGELADFVGAAPGDLAFVPNATSAVNAVLRSMKLRPGDELLVTDHAYPACRNVLDFVAKRADAEVVIARLPYPRTTPEGVVEAILEKASSRTRIALIDHITSQTGMVLPIEAIVRGLHERGVRVLVDGAHGPGQVPLDLATLAPDWYAANLHKWVCAPKGAGFLYAREDRRAGLHPAVISHGYSFSTRERSRFQLEFDWIGTLDPSAWLTVPVALETVAALHPEGWPGVMQHNRRLALRARHILAEALGVQTPCPEDMVGSMAAMPLPKGKQLQPESFLYQDPLQLRLLEAGFEVPIVPFPAPPARLIRISAQLYNRPADYERLAGALRAALT